ncbi:MAG: VOC family protein [Caulobacteraceae bacterium]
MTALRLSRVLLPVADLARTERFYRQALSFAALANAETAAASSATLRLGAQIIELVAHQPPGAPYPADSRCIDLWFQHLAIVVADMGAAYAQLRAFGDFTAITEGGPQALPPASGSVGAFKFRDPEGHPLELLYFPPATAPPRWRGPPPGALFLGIDHSAITVADTAASVAFYEERLGLTVTARSLNRGIEQERLDDAPGAVVEVTALSPAEAASPHVELLRYREPAGGRPMPAGGQDSDIAATRLIFEGGRGGPEPVPIGSYQPDRDKQALTQTFERFQTAKAVPALAESALRDPDGHRLALTPAG